MHWEMAGSYPESFNAINMIFRFLVHHTFRVIHRVMFAKAFEGVIAPELVRIVDRSFSRVLPDVGHEFIGCDSFHHFRVHPPIALQKPKHNAFAGCTPSALAFPPATKVGLVNLNLTLQSASLKLCHMIDRLTQALVDAGHHLIRKAEITCHAIRRLLLVEAGENMNLFAQALERLLFPTALPEAFHIAAHGLAHLERTAEDALSTSQKVGRTVENVLLTSNHKGIVSPCGYETD